MSVVLVDAGGTNIGSVRYALQRLGVDAELTSDADEIRAADKVILPGVGAAGPGMARLQELQLVDVIRSLSQPVLGVCLGMQLLCEHSEESDTSCLGVIPASVYRFKEAPGQCVPHMGWNRLSAVEAHPLIKQMDDGDWAYFVHSYAVPLGTYTLASTDYGDGFSSIITHRNFHGMQFHPERSASVGAKLLKNFLEL